MSTLPFDHDSQPLVPPVVAGKISEVVKRARGIRLLGSLVMALTATAIILLMAIAVDWSCTLFDPEWRILLTKTSLIAMGLLAIACLARGVMQRVSTLEAAHRIDQQVPQLEERWQSVTDFSTKRTASEFRGSEAFIRKVAQEAAELERIVLPQQIRQGKELQGALTCLAGVVIAWLLLAAVDFEQATVLVRRFLSPQSTISLTQVTAVSGDIVLPRGSRLKLEATIAGRPQKSMTLFIRQEGEKEEAISLDTKETGGRTAANPKDKSPSQQQPEPEKSDGQVIASIGAAYVVKDLQAPFSYRFRSGDGQTEWHTVRIAERPTMVRVDFQIIPPAYSKLPTLHQEGLPKSIKALHGSELVLQIASSVPLKSCVLQREQSGDITLREAPFGPNLFEWKIVLENTIVFRPLLTSEEGLTNAQPPRCEIVVFQDRAPTIEVANPTNEIALRPDDTVTISFQAKDDLGVSKAELVVFDPDGDGTQELKVIPIPLGDQAGEKTITAQADLDLSDFDLKHGQQLTYAVRVYDTKDAVTTEQPGSPPNDSRQQNAASQPGPREEEDGNIARSEPPLRDEKSSTETNAQSSESKTTQESSDNSPSDSKDSKAAESVAQSTPESDQPTSPNSEQNPSESKNDQSPEDPANKNEQLADNKDNQNAKQPDAPQKSLEGGNTWKPKSSKQQPQKEQQPGGEMTGKRRPDFLMSKRELDTPGQCTSCSRRKIKIDEWAGTFQSQVLEKLQLQIDPVLAELKLVLKQAQETLQPVADRAVPVKDWTPDESIIVRKGDEFLESGELKVRDLTAKSDGTPYAFIGLQLQDISQLHIHPARELLGDVTLLDGAAKPGDLSDSVVHIRRAIELLEKLTREYEAVKLNQKLSDTMVQIKKMHQVFIEGTFAMLKSQKPNLNPKDREFMEFELTDEFLRKLQELMQKKLEIQAELAKVLSKDPRLLERYMARSRLEATSLRDQLTLLHGRQRSLVEAVEEALPPADQPDGKFELKNRVLRRTEAAVLISEEIAQMLDNYVVWTPLKLDHHRGGLAKFKTKGLKLSATASELVKKARGDDTKQAIETGQALYNQLVEWKSTLPELLEEYDDPKLPSHVANRIEESKKLITDVSGWVLKEQGAELGDHYVVAEVDQHRIAVDTSVLTQKLNSLGAQCRGINDQLAASAKSFLKTMEQDLLPELEEAQIDLDEDNGRGALKHQNSALEHFASAEKQLDEIIDGIIKHLDSLPYEKTPTLPDDVKPESLEELLAMLDEEARAIEGLGIPCRPSNLMLEKDWSKPGSDPGGGGGGGGGAQAGRTGRHSMQPSTQMDKAKQAQQQTDKMRAQFADSLKRMSEKRIGTRAGKLGGGDPDKPERKWDTLGSKLEDHLRQGRGNLPPEQYRKAIEQYFESLSGKSKSDSKGD